MPPTYVNTITVNKAKLEERREKIAEILNKGGVVKFTNTLNGITKFVNNATKDADGDMTAFKYNGRTSAVCWEALEYEITEAKPEEYSAL